jgi:ubiquinone/menaquinone biosynthesis C-methylase UbiE
MLNSLVARDPTRVTHETYISGNPVIRVCLRRFLSRVAGLLAHIGAPALYGLDVGCGEGHMLGDLYQRGLLGRVVAVDLDPTCIAFARARYPFCDYRTGDVHHLGFADGTFDYLLAAEVLEHFPDPRHALKELRREFEGLLEEFVAIEKRFAAATFPWLLYLGRFHQTGRAFFL